MSFLNDEFIKQRSYSLVVQRSLLLELLARKRNNVLRVRISVLRMSKDSPLESVARTLVTGHASFLFVQSLLSSTPLPASRSGGGVEHNGSREIPC